LPLRENEGAENVPDSLVFREIYVRPVNGYDDLATSSDMDVPAIVDPRAEAVR